MAGDRPATLLALILFGVTCGDNLKPAISVDTHVASNMLAVGDPVGAPCTIVDR